MSWIRHPTETQPFKLNLWIYGGTSYRRKKSTHHQGDVQEIQASGHAFAAVLSDGSVVTWGDADFGGDSSQVQEQLKDVQQIQSSRRSGFVNFSNLLFLGFLFEEVGKPYCRVSEDFQSFEDGYLVALIAK